MLIWKVLLDNLCCPCSSKQCFTCWRKVHFKFDDGFHALHFGNFEAVDWKQLNGHIDQLKKNFSLLDFAKVMYQTTVEWHVVLTDSVLLMHYQHVTDRQTDGQRNVLVAIMRSTHCANAAAHKNQNQATNTEQTVSLLSLNSKSNSRDVNQGQN